MTAALPPDVWVPVPVRFRHVVAGDTFVGNGAKLWHVTKVTPDLAQLRVEAHQGDTVFRVAIDPDEVVDVLTPVPERDALELTRDALGARLIERRTAPPRNES
jgi:hypothetical protein